MSRASRSRSSLAASLATSPRACRSWWFSTICILKPIMAKPISATGSSSAHRSPDLVCTISDSTTYPTVVAATAIRARRRFQMMNPAAADT